MTEPTTDLTVPDGTIDQVELWMLEPEALAEQLVRARSILAKEQAAAKPRAKLLELVTEYIDAGEQLLAAAAAPTPAAAVPGPFDEPAAPELVRCRWTGRNPVMVPGTGVVLYGDEVYLTADQAADERTTAVPWDDGWVPDPVINQLCRTAAGLDQED